MTALPAMHAIHRRLPGTRIPDLEEATHQALARLELDPRIRGRRIALTAGSRGIAQIAVVLRAAVDHLRRCGADPLVVAAMGSHGRGTSDGQRRLLAHLGITQETVGAPISTRMETVVIGHTPDGLAAFCDRAAAGCDGILVVNRIKPHTIFFEPFGSGLMKMLGVGLGKVEGATQIHRQGLTALPGAIRAMAQVYLDRGMVVGGLAVVENARDEPAIVEALFPNELVEREMALFARAREMMPRLPVEEMDVLVVDRVGKNFSGTGMDPTIIGRMRVPGMPEPASPRIGRIVALRLSPESEGNANGIGLADLTTQRLVDAIDREVTNLNAITSTFIQRTFIPITLPSDRDAIVTAFKTLGIDEPRKARVVRIANTLHLERLLVSQAVAEEMHDQEGVEIGEGQGWPFDPDGWLIDL
ncbi:MAG: lactate racemase domain-containing protein [bacterium]|nr:lactate racemase domain-containing protein [bacterium]